MDAAWPLSGRVVGAKVAGGYRRWMQIVGAGALMVAEQGVVDAAMAADRRGGGVVDAELAVGAEVVGGYRLEAADHHQKMSQQMNCQNCSHPSYL